jgi:two-component system, NtrC family, sensor histidine kinase HydH
MVLWRRAGRGSLETGSRHHCGVARATGGESDLADTRTFDHQRDVGPVTIGSPARLVVLPVIAVLILGLFHHFTATQSIHWINILRRLYYLPIVMGGLMVGWRGGVGLALLASAAFAQGTPAIWTVSRVQVVDQMLEMCIFCLVGVLTGVLADRQRKQQFALRRTTRELSEAHRKLQDNFERMKRAERIYALGQLSSGLAHEIRNPLASIEGAAAVVQRNGQTQEQRREFLQIIQTESRRLNRLLTSFLEFAKPRPLDVQRVDIDDLFDAVIILARHASGANGLNLSKDVQPGLPLLPCDSEQIKQVLLNLVMNAIQAMPNAATVRLGARREGNSVQIEVEDEGGGIRPENLERIFDPFFTTKTAGTGLGLSVAHQIVTQHLGTLTIARNSPQGVTVRVSLPLQQSRA